MGEWENVYLDFFQMVVFHDIINGNYNIGWNAFVDKMFGLIWWTNLETENWFNKYPSSFYSINIPQTMVMDFKIM